MSVLDQGLRRLHDRLVATGLPAFVGGSVAAMIHSEPRSTLGIDLVVQAGPADLERLERAWPEPDFYCPPREVLADELRRPRDGHFNVIDLASGLKADVYLAGDDPLIAYGFAHAREESLGEHRLRVAPATYIVAMKLRYWSVSHQDKHLRDIRSMLRVSPEAIDRAEVARWAERYRATAAWERCQARSGEEDP